MRNHLTRAELLGFAAAVLAVVLMLVALPLMEGYQGRKDIIDGQRVACRAAVNVWTALATAAEKIAADPFQSKITRIARRDEAVVIRRAVKDEAGDPADCNRAHPSAAVLP